MGVIHCAPTVILCLFVTLTATAQDDTIRFEDVFIGENVRLVEVIPNEQINPMFRVTSTPHPIAQLSTNRLTYHSPHHLEGTNLLQWVEYDDDDNMYVYILDETTNTVSLVYETTCFLDCYLDRVTTNAAFVFPPDQLALTNIRYPDDFEGGSYPATLEIVQLDTGETILLMDERGRMPDVQWFSAREIFVQNYVLESYWDGDVFRSSYVGAFIDLSESIEPVATYPLYTDLVNDLFSDVGATQGTDNALSPDGRFLLVERNLYQPFPIDLVRVSYSPLTFSEPEPFMQPAGEYFVSMEWLSDTHLHVSVIDYDLSSVYAAWIVDVLEAN